MSGVNTRQVPALETRQELKLFLRIEQSNVLEMTEEEFQRLVIEIKNSPLFKRLHEQERIIRYQPFLRSNLSRHFYEIKEEVVASPESFDIESLITNKRELVSLIRNIGLDKFKQYFLYPEEGLTDKAIASQCQLDISDVKKINKLIDEISIASGFYHPSSIPGQGIHYSKVASIEEDSLGFTISYFSPLQARGKFMIDYEKFEELVKAGTFSSEEAKGIRQLFKKLELINNRKNTLHLVLLGIVDKQALFLKSGDPKTLLPFTQKELAEKTSLAPSSISRAISRKSVDTPWGERALKDFFPHPKKFRKDLIKKLLENEEEPLSDRLIGIKLKEKFGVVISRRAISSLRKELKIPSSRKRRSSSLNQVQG